MLKLLAYGTMFYLGYRWGMMTPEERQQFISGVAVRGKAQIAKVDEMVIDEDGNPAFVTTG